MVRYDCTTSVFVALVGKLKQALGEGSDPSGCVILIV